MSFCLEGPNIASTQTTATATVNSSTGGGGGGSGSGGAGGSTLPSSQSAMDEITSSSTSPYSPQPPPSTCTSPVIPPLLMSLRYRARVRGLMQPRRMDAALPNPSFMANGSGTLPKMHNRPSLEHISSVAVLERPQAATTALEGSSAATAAVASPSAQGVAVAEDDNGAGPSNTSPSSSAYTSLAASPEGPVPLAAAPLPSSGGASAATAAAPAPNAAAVTQAAPLWRRILGLEGIRPASHQRQRHSTTNAISAAGSTSDFSLLHARRGATFDESALPVCLVNKSPHWNEALRCWCLNFRGRVKLASVKNFQLVKDGDEEAKVSMQFGKFDKELFILDFNPMTLSAIQAFAIALTTFDSKVTL
jgi:hypothetical protein